MAREKIIDSKLFLQMCDGLIRHYLQHFLFEEPKPRIVVETPFCELNEKRVSTFRKTFN